MNQSLQDQARRIYADTVAADGPGYANTANNIRAGYENIWIKVGIKAIEQTLRGMHDGEEVGRA